MTTTADTILAIDLGRFKSVACVYSRSTRHHAFRTLDSKPDALAHLLAEHPGAVVVIEACANGGGDLTSRRPPRHAPPAGATMGKLLPVTLNAQGSSCGGI